MGTLASVALTEPSDRYVWAILAAVAVAAAAWFAWGWVVSRRNERRHGYSGRHSGDRDRDSLLSAAA